MCQRKDIGKKGAVFWITGLSGAGKTTTGKALRDYLRSHDRSVVFLDGDILRDVYQERSCTNNARHELAFRNARLVKMLSDQGFDVVICIIGMYDDCRLWNRENIDRYHEIFLNTTMDELLRRDQKQLYSRAMRNEIEDVLGVNAPYESPKNPDLIIANDGSMSIEQVLERIIQAFDLPD